jgi:hypothetical protein
MKRYPKKVMSLSHCRAVKVNLSRLDWLDVTTPPTSRCCALTARTYHRFG